MKKKVRDANLLHVVGFDNNSPICSLNNQMLLLKKRKAEMQLKMQAAAKKKLESETTAAASVPAASSPKPSTVKPVTSPKPLPSVPEGGSTEDNKLESKSAEMKESAAPAPAPLTFGSSTTISGFGVPASMPAKSEPTCPKPSFFGASTAAPAVFGSTSNVSAFGAGSTPAFGSGAAPVFGSSTSTGFGFGTKKPEEKIESPDNKQQPAPAGGPFLDLTPPGKATKPSQFVFGKSANITLPVPAPSPFGVFNQQKTQATPFGSAFNTNPPFGGGTSASTSPEKSAEAEKVGDKKKEETEDGEVEESSADKEGAQEA
jgi:nucleoprotein TPR